MPKFAVKLSATAAVVMYGYVEVEADTLDEAEELAVEIGENDWNAAGWDLQLDSAMLNDDSVEAEETTEIEDDEGEAA